MTVLSAFLTSVVFLGFGVYATVRHFSVGAVSYTRVFGNASLTLNGTVFVVLNIIFVALLAVIALFIGELLLYHCWLAWQGISTFQHYLEKRARIEGTEPPARPTRRRDQRVLTTLVRPNQAVLDTPDEKKKSANKRKGRRWLGRRDNRIQPIANVAGDGVSTDPAPDPSPNPAAAVSWNAASPSMRQNGGAMAWTATSDPRTEGNSRAAAVETPRQRDEDGFVESDHDDTLEVNAPQDLDRTRSISPALSRATLRALPAPPSLVSTTDGAPPSLALLPLPSPTVAPPTASSITRTAPTSPQTAPPCDTPNLTFPRTPSKVPTDEANEASRRTSQSVRERRRKTRTRTDQATRRRRSVDDSDIDPLAMTGAHGSATLAELAAYAKRLRDETMNAIESKGPGKEKSDDNEAPIPRKIWPDSLSGGERTVSAKTLPRLEMENEGHVDSEPSLAALVQAAHATDPIGDLSNSPRRTSALLANARRESAPRVVVHSVDGSSTDV